MQQLAIPAQQCREEQQAMLHWIALLEAGGRDRKPEVQHLYPSGKRGVRRSSLLDVQRRRQFPKIGLPEIVCNSQPQAGWEKGLDEPEVGLVCYLSTHPCGEGRINHRGRVLFGEGGDDALYLLTEGWREAHSRRLIKICIRLCGSIQGK